MTWPGALSAVSSLVPGAALVESDVCTLQTGTGGDERAALGLAFVVCGMYSERYITGVYGCKIINLGEGKKGKNKFMQ